MPACVLQIALDWHLYILCAGNMELFQFDLSFFAHAIQTPHVSPQWFRAARGLLVCCPLHVSATPQPLILVVAVPELVALQEKPGVARVTYGKQGIGKQAIFAELYGRGLFGVLFKQVWCWTAPAPLLMLPPALVPPPVVLLPCCHSVQAL